MVSLDEVRQMLDVSPLCINSKNSIKSGKLSTTDGRSINFDIYVEWNLKIARMCETHWGDFNIRLLEFIRQAIDNGADRNTLLSQTQFGDAHWEWLKKALAFQDERYRWFTIFAEDVPQAVCVIFQPKASVISPDSNIFYIEYLATAPWNRNNLMGPKKLGGMGTLIIETACEYAINQLGLRPGFSLHSLPGAIDFYRKIGMSQFPQHDKDSLVFFEIFGDLNHLGRIS